MLLPTYLCLQSVVSVLRNCTDNSSQLAAAVAASAAARTGAGGRAVDPTRVQQIVEMGFSEAQAEEALRRVSVQSVQCGREGGLCGRPDVEQRQLNSGQLLDVCDCLTRQAHVLPWFP